MKSGQWRREKHVVTRDQENLEGRKKGRGNGRVKIDITSMIVAELFKMSRLETNGVGANVPVRLTAPSPIKHLTTSFTVS